MTCSRDPSTKFIADHNVGKLARWLRMMGLDTILFTGGDDSEMVALALAEGRTIRTRDTEILKRRLVTSGRLKALLVESEVPEDQVRQVARAAGLAGRVCAFTLCLECNRPLVRRTREDVKDLVPPYVFRTQEGYMQCPNCRRVYWQGTHWEAMARRLEKLLADISLDRNPGY
ncbi:MAG: Mut7-C RNAse domain-containing protein [Chloroflexi bacterium]|nr:Mut7-C RNAse domain-containing protein [Chloroflexota bacterium]